MTPGQFVFLPLIFTFHLIAPSPTGPNHYTTALSPSPRPISHHHGIASITIARTLPRLARSLHTPPSPPPGRPHPGQAPPPLVQGRRERFRPGLGLCWHDSCVVPQIAASSPQLLRYTKSCFCISFSLPSLHLTSPSLCLASSSHLFPLSFPPYTLRILLHRLPVVPLPTTREHRYH